MRIPRLSALCIAVWAAASTISSCSGGLASGTRGDAGSSMDSGIEGAPPASAVREVSLTMTRVNFGDSPTSNAWQDIGFDLDGKDTTPSSTDVCTLTPGAPQATQTDGLHGVDNSFGENVCPILDTLVGTGACSGRITQAYVVTDSTGSGTLAFKLTGYWLEIPVVDAYVLNDAGSGTVGAVTTYSDILTAAKNGAILLGQHCPAGDPGVNTLPIQLEQTSDILSDGSNAPGRPCNAISIGMQFSNATPFHGPLPFVPDACPD